MKNDSYQKFKPIIAYLIFGVLTTAVNVAVYHGCYAGLRMPNLISTLIAWFVAVSFAFVTNKLFVFESKSWDKMSAALEAAKFFGCRIGTGVVELGMMYIFVDMMQFNGTIMKLITNFVVILLNFILSKLVVFTKGK